MVSLEQHPTSKKINVFIIHQTLMDLLACVFLVLTIVSGKFPTISSAGRWVSEQFRNGTSAHNRPFQCRTMDRLPAVRDQHAGGRPRHVIAYFFSTLKQSCPFCVTRSNPTHQLTDPTEPTTSGKIWTQPDPTHYN